jgi:hypothetical protein
LNNKFFHSIIWLCFTTIGFAQHFNAMKVRVNTDEKTLLVQQELTFQNSSPDTLKTIILNDWNHAFSSKSSALANRFSDEFVRAFHLANESDRGYTQINSVTDEKFQTIQWNRNEKAVDIVEITLNQPIPPYSSQKIMLTYWVKIPNNRFTKYGYDSNGKLYLKDWFLSPARYENRRFLLQSNENLNDKTNALANYSIEVEIPKNYYLASNLKTDKRDNHWLLTGKNYLDVELVVTPNEEFTNYSNEFIEVSSSLRSNRISDIQHALVIDKITRFTAEKIGKPVSKKILVSQEDYNREPYYGLNQLPAFLSPYPDELMFELMFLKTYLNNYLKANLQLNNRKEYWISDGIQIFLMMQYVEEFYPDLKMTGNLASFKILKSYNLINIDFNQQYNYLYMLMARKNLDQPLAESKENLVKFNEQISSKYRAGLSFNYLDNYLGNDIVAKSIQEFITNSAECPTSKYDLEYILKKNTKEDINWFFETVINTRKLIDFKFGTVKKTDENVTVTIKNKTQTNVPISFYGLKNDTVVFKKWITNVSTDTTFVVPRNGADKLTLNYFNEIPEYNLRNNWKSLKGFFYNNRPLKLNFFRDLEEPYYNQLFYVPEFEFNLYDGLAFGMNFNNKSLLNKPFNFSVTPFYSPNTQSMVGKASFSIDQLFRDEGSLYRIRYIMAASQFHYAPDARYTKINPIVQFFFRDKDLRRNKNEFIQMRQLFASRESSPFILDNNTEDYNLFNIKYGNIQSEGTKHFSFLSDLQVANSFGKVYTEIHYRKLFENNRQISLRFFAGTFLYRSTTSDFFSFGLDQPTDYMFELPLLGRSETTGLYSQQYVYAEGGFKSKFDVRFANQWMTTTNATFNIWNWVQVYGDIGLFKNQYQSPRFVYDSGFHLNLVPDYFELFFPVYSSNGFAFNENNYDEKIRFVVTLTPQTLISLFTRKWF